MGLMLSAVEERCVSGCSDRRDLAYDDKQNKTGSNTKLITEGSNATNSEEEENSKLTNVINEMNDKMEAQRIENESLKKQLDEQNILKEQLASLQMKLDMMEYTENDNISKQDEMKNANPNILYVEENISETDTNDAILRRIKSHEKNVTEHRVKDTLEKTKNGEDVATVIMARYKSADVYNEGDLDTNDMVNIDEDDESSSFEEHEKLEIEQRKSFVIQSKSLEQETVAMKKELLTMHRVYSSQDGDGNKLDMNDNNNNDNDDDITNDKMKHLKVTINGIEDEIPGASNLFRDESSAKWDVMGLSQHKQEMQAHLIHLVSSHTKSISSDTTDTPKDISTLQ